MFTLIVIFKVKPGCTSTFTHALTRVASLTRLETGNMVYEFSVDEGDINQIFLYEKYRNRESYELHTRQDYLNIFRAEIADLLEEAPTVIRGKLQN